MDRNRAALIRRISLYGILLLPLLFLALFYVYPLGSILRLSLAPEGPLDFQFLRDLPDYLDTLLFTVGQALLSTALTLVLALPTAYVFVRYQFPGKSLLLSLSTLAFVLPTVVVAAAFRALIGEQGLLNALLMQILQLEIPPIRLERTLTIILIAHVFYNFAVALRLITSYWSNQSTRVEEAARILGARGWRLWWYIRFPMLRPALLASAILVFIFTFTSFGVIIILGGLRFATLEVEIYQQTFSYLNLPVAASLSVVQIGLMLLLMIVYTRLQRSMAIEAQSSLQVTRSPRTFQEHAIVLLTIILMVCLLFAPLLALIMRSFVGPERLTLENYTHLVDNVRGSILFVPPLQAVGNSVIFALITTVVAVGLGLIAAYLLNQQRWLDAIFMLPLATSAVTLGLGFIVALDEPPLNLRSSPILIPIAHTLVALPFVVRSLLPALSGIEPRLRESASILGAKPMQIVRWIDLPLISRGLVVGATFAFTISMGEFGASVFVARPNTPTMPVAIFRLLSQPGAINLGQALAMSVLLMLVCGVSFVVIERVRSAGIGEF